MFADIKLPSDSPVTMRDLGGMMASGLIAVALLEALKAKGILSLAEVLSTIQSARGALGHDPVGPLDNEAATILDWLMTVRFAENSVRE